MAWYAGAEPVISEDQIDDENNFSEEEEALYVAANDSEMDSDPQANWHGQNLELSNVAVFRRAQGESPEPDQHAFHPRPAAGWPSQAYIPQDDRTLILFDLNGVLVHHTFNGSSHKHFLRPGAEQLLRLVPHYRLGIYSSATQRTVQRAMAKLHEDLVAALPEGEHPPPGGYFEVVLCRDHCVLAKEVGATRKGGKPWDTVKPLGRYFQDLTQVVLVDDSPHKSLPEEAGNMLLMPGWAGPEKETGLTDAALPALVDGFVEALESLQKKTTKKKVAKRRSPRTKSGTSEDVGDVAVEGNRIQDIRPIVAEITKTLVLLYPPPPPSASEDDEEEEGEEDAGQATMLNKLSLKSKNGKRITPPPPGLPPPSHLLRSGTRSRAAAAAAAAAATAAAAGKASIGAEAINHHAALYFFVLVKLKETPAIPGASLFDINTLLQRRSVSAYSKLFKNSAKPAINRLVEAGTLNIIPGNTSTDRATRFSLKKEGIKLPSSQRLLEIEQVAQRLPVPQRPFPRGKKPAGVVSEAQAEDGNGELDTSTQNNSTIAPEVLDTMTDDLVISILAELETRPGVSKESLDASITTIFTPIPALQGWFGSHVSTNVQRKVNEALRRVTQDALDAWCSSGDVEMVGMRGGGTPPSLFHVQITPEKGVLTVENAVFDMQKLVEDAAQDMAIVLQQRGVPYVDVGTAGGGSIWGGELAGVLPVFEDRGILTARAVPMGDVAMQQLLLNDTAAAKKTTSKKKKKKLNTTTDDVIDLTEDADLLPAKKKQKNKATTATTTTKTATVTTTPGGTEIKLTRGQQKLAAMRAKLGLPQDCGLTKAQLKELVKEANREKQKMREEEIQAAKAAKQRGAALTAPNATEDAGAAAGSTKSTKNEKLTPLHLEIAELAKQATPTPSEIATVQAAVHAVDSAARGIWPAARAVLFGSQATGLALPGGDLDIVVLGVGPQLQRATTGFTAGQRRVLGEHLADLLDALRKSGTLLTSVQIIDAKIPIIKCLIQTSRAGPALPVDISFGAVNGAAAVTFLRRQILAVPPLRPLSLAVKAFLRDKGLNEVFTGGVGSYAIVNMVLAHLQREGFQADITQADKLGLSRSSLLQNIAPRVVIIDGRVVIQTAEQQQQAEAQKQQQQGNTSGAGIGYDDEETFKYLGQLAAATSNNSGGGGSSAKTNRRNSGGAVTPTATNNDSDVLVGPHDYGMLLWSFLQRFSHEFDFLRQAISIRQGGFVKKGKWKQARRPWLLAVEDPQEPGKDICSGSFNINYVRDEFAAASQILAEVSEDAEANLLASRGSGRSGKKISSTTSLTDKMPMLSLLMDVECAVGRTPAANAARRALEHRAEEARQAIKAQFQYSNSQKRPSSRTGFGDSRGNKRQKFADDADFPNPFGLGYPPQQHQPDSFQYPSSLPAKQQQQQQQQKSPQRQSQEKHTPKGSGGRGSQPRGSKASRAVAAEWKDTRGQFLDYGDDGPDYRGGGSGQESMQLQKYKGGKFSKRKTPGNTEDSQGAGAAFSAKKKKGVKRKPKNAAAAARGGNTKFAGGDLGPKTKNMKKKTKPKKKAAATPASSTGTGKKKKQGGRRKSS